MFRVNRWWAVLIITVMFAGVAAAQKLATINGEVLDVFGNPFPDVDITIKSQTGAPVMTKTDKDGKFTQADLKPGIYTITFVKPASNANPNPPINYSTEAQVGPGDNMLKMDFKAIYEKMNPGALDELKKRAEEQNKFQNLKQHFDAGLAALNDSNTVKTQLAAAPADQKQPLHDKMTQDCTTALNEFTQAEQAALGPKDVNNHAAILGNMGVANECLGKYQDAADTFQKALALKPQPGYYSAMATDLAHAGKVPDAMAACDKLSTLTPPDPKATDLCWKNIGIVLSNAGNMKDAVDPLKKATDADPKDAQAWYLLGGALAGQISTQQQGDKLVYIIPPGTTDAYQKSIDADPNGPYAAQSKAALDGLNALSGGESTKVNERPNSKTKKKS